MTGKFGKIFLVPLMAGLLALGGCRAVVEPDLPAENGGGGSAREAKVHSVDLTPLLEFAVFKQHKDFGDRYQFMFDVSDAFIALPEKGDEIEYKVSGSFLDAVGDVSVCFLDSVNDTYITLSGAVTYENVSKSGTQEFILRKKVPVTESAIGKVYLQLSYSSEKFNGESVFIPKGKSRGKIYKVDLTPCIEPSMAEKGSWAGNNHYTYLFDVTEAFKDYDELPKEGDIMEFTLEGSFNEKIEKLNFQFADASEKANGWTRVVTYTKLDNLEIEENKPIIIREKSVFIADSLENISIQIIYDADILDKEAIFIPKGETLPDPKTYNVDLTEYLSARVFSYWGEWSEHKWSGISYEVDAEELFKGDLPKKFDIINYTFTGTFSTDMDYFSVDFSMGNDRHFPISIKAGEEVSISRTIRINGDTPQKMTFNLLEYDEYGACMFIPKGAKLPKIHKLNLTPYLESSILTRTHNMDYNIKEAFGTDLPKKGDFAEITIEGKFDKNIDEVSLYLFDNSEKASWWRPLTDSARVENIKANEEIKITGFVSFTDDFEENIILAIFNIGEDFSDEVVFTPKGKTAVKVHEVDLTPRLTAISVKGEWSINSSDIFKTSLPEKGDIIKFTIRAKFSNDVETMSVWADNASGSGRVWGIWDTPVNATANKYVTITRVVTCEQDIDEKITIWLDPNISEICMIIPYGWVESGNSLPETYDIDLTEYMSATGFGDWGDSYGCCVSDDITDAFIDKFGTSPKKGDKINYTFTGIFTTNMSKIETFSDYDDGSWHAVFTDWDKPVDIKAGEEVTISGAVGIENIPDDGKINFKIRYPKEYGECIFIPKGKNVKTYEIDFTEYMDTTMINESWRDGDYKRAFYIEGTEFAAKYPLKKGDIVEFSFTGTFDKDIPILSVFLDGADRISIWAPVFNTWDITTEIKADEEVTITRTAVCEMDLQPHLYFTLSYPEEYGEAIFTPKG